MLTFVDSEYRRPSGGWGFRVEAVLDCSGMSERLLAEIERAGFAVVFRDDVPGGYCVEMNSVASHSAGRLLELCLTARSASAQAVAALAEGDVTAVGQIRQIVSEVFSGRTCSSLKELFDELPSD